MTKKYTIANKIPKQNANKIYLIATNYVYQMAKTYTKFPYNIPKGHKLLIPTFSVKGPPKIYPIWDFLFGNISSGNPGEEPPF
jgi:hypothetical protein